MYRGIVLQYSILCIIKHSRHLSVFTIWTQCQLSIRDYVFHKRVQIHKLPMTFMNIGGFEYIQFGMLQKIDLPRKSVIDDD